MKLRAAKYRFEIVDAILERARVSGAWQVLMKGNRKRPALLTLASDVES